LFLVLCAVFALWRLYSTFSFAISPSQSWQAMLGSLSLEERNASQHAAFISALIQTAYYLLPAAIFAVIAGFWGHNWARWGFVAVLLLMEVVPLLVAIYALALRPEFYSVVHHPILYWLHSYRLDAAHWTTWLRVAMKLALIALLFSKNAAPWFHRETSSHHHHPHGAVHA
jgi:hypothetical protein